MAIKEICEGIGTLDADEIEELERIAAEIIDCKKYPDADVFIDIYDEVTNRVIVVFHRRPIEKTSIYKKTVVGLVAKRENEPGVIRTLQTGIHTKGLLGISQEGSLINQSIYPITYKERIIGTLIIETEANEPELQRSENQVIADVFNTMYGLQDYFLDQLNEKVLIYNNQGSLVFANKEAKDLYKSVGYLNDIIGIEYDNLSLDGTTFSFITNYFRTNGNDISFKTEFTYLPWHFRAKYIRLNDNLGYIVLLEDKTEMKRSKEESISKSVAIKEIHHRIKNNLQSIISLLTIQARRTEHEEVKKVLHDSISRIMAIVSTHELLSQQVEKYSSLHNTLVTVIHNFYHVFSNYKEIEVDLNVDQNIFIENEQVVVISIIVNELIQNIFDHAYSAEEKGIVKISGLMYDQEIVEIIVEDNGCGFDPKLINGDSLGLMIINGYVKDKLKGQIKFDSSSKGTKVTVRFSKNTKEVILY